MSAVAAAWAYDEMVKVETDACALELIPIRVMCGGLKQTILYGRYGSDGGESHSSTLVALGWSADDGSHHFAIETFDGSDLVRLYDPQDLPPELVDSSVSSCARYGVYATEVRSALMDMARQYDMEADDLVTREYVVIRLVRGDPSCFATRSMLMPGDVPGELYAECVNLYRIV